jgi:hypothetical protein
MDVKLLQKPHFYNGITIIPSALSGINQFYSMPSIQHQQPYIINSVNCTITRVHENAKRESYFPQCTAISVV